MTVHNSTIDNYRATEGYFECRSCGSRTVSDAHLGSCPSCGGLVRNIAVARE
ncbi:rubrerythrin-like domain-containing protein [Haloferax profundi]|uniref:rubrerythrin-like domain-containing protein n=1 Tax=Haloferax profundi TaxID=1544718 RepID=UPI000AFFDDF2|nr:rubrerythrin-like domain-containing protein [Haloferax profundi]